MRKRWRRWLPGPKHGLPRSSMVYGHPMPPGPEVLGDLLVTESV